VLDPSAPHLVYSDSQGGTITLTDTRTGLSRSIHPYPAEVGSSGNAIADYKYRFNWNPPIALSPHDPRTVYYGGNVLFKTTDYGQSWEVISPDLTTNDKTKQQSSGGPVVTDNTAAEFHCTLLTIAESPVTRGVIWAGTDDGNVQVTRDGGKTWTNTVAKIAGLPANSWIPAIDASPFEAGTAYVAVDRHRNDDFRPYAFKTTDYGKTWKAIRGDLPDKNYVHVVREDPHRRDLLYAGTERGVFVSWDGGSRWIPLHLGNLPPVAVNDLQIHPRDNDLILATHGRGLYILDDLTPVQRLPEVLGSTDLALFDVRPAVRYQTWNRDANLGQRTYAADNPPYGALVHYYLKADLPEKDKITITVTDAQGKNVAEVDGSRTAGVNRAVWNLRYNEPRAVAGERPRGGDLEGGGRFGQRLGPMVLPGEYTVTVKAAGKETTKTVRVEMDPRIPVSEAELKEQLEAALALRDLTNRVNGVIERTEDLSRQLQTVVDRLKKGSSPALPVAEAALKQTKDLRGRLTRPTQGLGYRSAPRLREEIQALAGAVGGTAARPTEPQKVRLGELRAETDRVVADLGTLTKDAIGRLNEQLRDEPLVAVGREVR
jgi:photosystem II stability/assembly factor-like uncharacterized protein